MNKFLSFGIITTLALYGCGGEKNELAHNHEATSATAHEGIVLHGHEATRLGVKTERLSRTGFTNIIEATGKILTAADQTGTVTAPTSGKVTLASGLTAGMSVGTGQTIATISSAGMSGGDQNAAARARLDAAKRELDRLTPLFADGIVTLKDMNAARQAYDEARAGFSSGAASGRATSPIAGNLTEINVTNGQYVDAGAQIASVSGVNRLTLQIMLPERLSGEIDKISGVSLRPAGSDRWISAGETKASLSGSARGDMKSAGYVPVYFTLENVGTDAILPGMFAEVRLHTSPREGVLSVPDGAISEQQGAKFIYVRKDEDSYEKIPVNTGLSDGLRTEITGALLNDSMEIVTEGTIFVKLAESSGNVPEGHSHNH